MPTYTEKLKDPRWQKKRLEILKRDNFACRCCTRKDLTLHVHHLFYRKRKDPWGYDIKELLTLCADCHECEFSIRSDYEHDLMLILKQKGYLVPDLIGMIEDILASEGKSGVK